MNGRTGWVTPEIIHEPRGKSRVYGWRYEKSGFILSLEGPGVPAPTPHTHTHAHITYKTSYKGKFSEKSDSCLHPHIVHWQPPHDSLVGCAGNGMGGCLDAGNGDGMGEPGKP